MDLVGFLGVVLGIFFACTRLFSAFNLLLFILVVRHLGPGAHNASAAAWDGAD